jgi:pyruvate dehydrogenase E1 component alpha subunit
VLQEIKELGMAPPHDEKTLEWIYSRMTLIREFEERVNRDFLTGKLMGAIHLYSGEESVAAGVCSQLRSEDYLTTTHRPHGHCIAKGMELGPIMAELQGKAAGICRGRGGSMHLSDLSCGVLGANGIVPAGLPLACGAALSAKLRKTDQIAVAFFGDGGSNAGAFHEALNLASVLDLPVVFVLENNGYADATHIRYSARIENLSERAAGYGMPGVTRDGTDVFQVMEAAGEAVSRARKEHRPSLLEFKTYRYHGHFVGDAGTYRTRDEVNAHKQRDCIAHFEKRCLEQGWLSESLLESIKKDSKKRVSEAVEWADRSPAPSVEEYAEDVYVRYP